MEPAHKHLGRIDVRAQVGLGAGTSEHAPDETRSDATDMIARTTGATTTPPDDRHGHGGIAMTPRAEASLLVGLPLGRHFELAAGPVITATNFDQRGGDVPVDVTLFTGIGYRF